MGNAGSAAIKDVARAATSRKLQPFTASEIAAVNKMAEKDQARLRDLPSIEEMNEKDTPLDQLLSKLGGAIGRHDLAPDEAGQQPANSVQEASSSGRPAVQVNHHQGMPPARPRQALLQQAGAAPGLGRARRAQVSMDDQPGRVQAYVLREVLEARTESEAAGRQLDLAHFVTAYRADSAKLSVLMEHACLPMVGKVATFGHQYAYARAPLWWLRESSGSRFVSEPEEERLKQLWGSPVAPGSLPPSMTQPAANEPQPSAGGPASPMRGAGPAAVE